MDFKMYPLSNMAFLGVHVSFQGVFFFHIDWCKQNPPLKDPESSTWQRGIRVAKTQIGGGVGGFL